MNTVNIILLFTATTTALIAGLLYAYSVAISPGLARLPDAGYLAAMQNINREILNPVFFLSFMGTVLLLPLSTFLHYSQPVSPRFILLLLATIVYAAGTFGVTVVGNVPLNEALDAVNLSAATPEQLATYRANFEGPWNKLHAIRTVCNVIALMLVILACMNKVNAVSDAK